MTIQPIIIPADWTWAFDLVVGQDWPQADEDALRRVAQAWTDTLQGLENIADGGNTVAQNVNYSVQARSSDEFNNYWKQYVDGDNSVIGQLAQQCEYLAEFLLSFAEQTEFTKLSINIQIVILIIQLIIDAALAIVTFGASTAEGVAATFITRQIVQGFLFHFLEGVLAAVLPDVITQWKLISEGHRSSFDVGEALQALQMGVVGGLIGAGIGAVGGSGILGKLGGRLLGDAGEAGGNFLGHALTNPMVHGATTNLATNAATGLIDSGENQIHAYFDPAYAQQLQQQTQDQGYADEKAGQNPLIAMLNGAFMGTVFHGVHEGATALAGFPEAQPLTLDNQQQFAAVQLQGGTGSKYALFDQKMNLVGTGTTDGNNITINLKDGSSYTAGITQLGDFSPAPVTSGTIPVTPEVHNTPTDIPPQDQTIANPTTTDSTATDPATPNVDYQPTDQPVTSADPTGHPTTQESQQPPQTSAVPSDPRSVTAPPQSPETPVVQTDPRSTTGTSPVGGGLATQAGIPPDSGLPASAAPENQLSPPVGQQPPTSAAIPGSSDGALQQTYQPNATAEPASQAAAGSAAVQPDLLSSNSTAVGASQNSESPLVGPILYAVGTADVSSSGGTTQALSGVPEEPGSAGATSLSHPSTTAGAGQDDVFVHRSPDRLPGTRPRLPLADVPADATLVSSRRAGIFRLADDGTGIAKYGKMIDGQFHVIVEGDLPAGREKAVYALFDRDSGGFLKFGQLSGSDALTRYSAENLGGGERDFRLEARGEGRYPRGYDRYTGDPPLSGRKAVLKIIASHLSPAEADAIEKHGLNQMWGGPANVEREYTDDNLYHRQELQTEAAASGNSFFDWVQRKMGADTRWANVDLRALHAAFPDPEHEPVLPGQPGGRLPYPLNANPLFHDDGSPWTGPPQHASPELAGYPGQDPSRPYTVVEGTEVPLAGAKPTAEELRDRLMTLFHEAGDDPLHSHELAIAYKPGADGQPGRLIIIEGTHNSVGLPPGYEDYRIIIHTQQGEGPSPADRAAAIAAGHPLEMIVYHDTRTGGRTRAELFIPEETDPAKGIYDYNDQLRSDNADRTQARPLDAMLGKLVAALPDTKPSPATGPQEHHSPQPDASRSGEPARTRRSYAQDVAHPAPPPPYDFSSQQQVQMTESQDPQLPSRQPSEDQITLPLLPKPGDLSPENLHELVVQVRAEEDELAFHTGRRLLAEQALRKAFDNGELHNVPRLADRAEQLAKDETRIANDLAERREILEQARRRFRLPPMLDREAPAVGSAGRSELDRMLELNRQRLDLNERQAQNLAERQRVEAAADRARQQLESPQRAGSSSEEIRQIEDRLRGLGQRQAALADEAQQLAEQQQAVIQEIGRPSLLDAVNDAQQRYQEIIKNQALNRAEQLRVDSERDQFQQNPQHGEVAAWRQHLTELGRRSDELSRQATQLDRQLQDTRQQVYNLLHFGDAGGTGGQSLRDAQVLGQLEVPYAMRYKRVLTLAGEVLEEQVRSGKITPLLRDEVREEFDAVRRQIDGADPNFDAIRKMLQAAQSRIQLVASRSSMDDGMRGYVNRMLDELADEARDRAANPQAISGAGYKPELAEFARKPFAAISQKISGQVSIDVVRTAEGGVYLRFRRLVDAISYEESPLQGIRAGFAQDLFGLTEIDHGQARGEIFRDPHTGLGVGVAVEANTKIAYTPGHEFEQKLGRGDIFGIKLGGPGRRLVAEQWDDLTTAKGQPIHIGTEADVGELQKLTIQGNLEVHPALFHDALTNGITAPAHIKAVIEYSRSQIDAAPVKNSVKVAFEFDGTVPQVGDVGKLFLRSVLSAFGVNAPDALLGIADVSSEAALVIGPWDIKDIAALAGAGPRWLFEQARGLLANQGVHVDDQGNIVDELENAARQPTSTLPAPEAGQITGHLTDRLGTQSPGVHSGEQEDHPAVQSEPAQGVDGEHLAISGLLEPPKDHIAGLLEPPKDHIAGLLEPPKDHIAGLLEAPKDHIAGLLEGPRGDRIVVNADAIHPVVDEQGKPAGAQILGSGDQILTQHMGPIKVPGAFVVEMHGSGGHGLLDPALPDQLRAAGWDGKSPLVLASCRALLEDGRGLVQELSAALPGVRVVGATTDVSRDHQGRVIAATVYTDPATGNPKLTVDSNGNGDGDWLEYVNGAQVRVLRPSDDLLPPATDIRDPAHLATLGTEDGQDTPADQKRPPDEYTDQDQTRTRAGSGQLEQADTLPSAATDGSDPRSIADRNAIFAALSGNDEEAVQLPHPETAAPESILEHQQTLEPVPAAVHPQVPTASSEAETDSAVQHPESPNVPHGGASEAVGDEAGSRAAAAAQRTVPGSLTSSAEVREDPNLGAPHHQTMTNTTDGGSQPPAAHKHESSQYQTAAQPGGTQHAQLHMPPSEELRAHAVAAVASYLGITDPHQVDALADAYDVVHEFPATLIVKVASDMLPDLHADVEAHPGLKVVFVGRDGTSIGLAVRQLDPEFYVEHCTDVVLSRAAVETAVQDLEVNAGKSFPELADFRGAAGKADPAQIAGARERLTTYLRSKRIDVGIDGSHVTLVDTSYKGTVQELLKAVYPNTEFQGRYAFFAASPSDPHPGTKQGYVVNLEGDAANGGLPVRTLPDDPSLTFSHQSAIASIEETLHGPNSSPRGISETGPVQEPIRNDPHPLEGFNPLQVSGKYSDPAVREGVMHIGLRAVSDEAVEIAGLRDSGGDYQATLNREEAEYQDQIRKWILGGQVDPKLAEYLNSFVRPMDKRNLSAIADIIASQNLDSEHATSIWERYQRLTTQQQKDNFVVDLRRGVGGQGA